MDHWRAMIQAQGGDPDAPLPRANHTEIVRAERDGMLTRLDAMGVGIAAWRLGAGRARQGDPVQAGAGIEMHAKPGDSVTAGQPLLMLHTDTPEAFSGALAALSDVITINDGGDSKPNTELILDRIGT
jgi:thymidine phosphorylase